MNNAPIDPDAPWVDEWLWSVFIRCSDCRDLPYDSTRRLCRHFAAQYGTDDAILAAHVEDSHEWWAFEFDDDDLVDPREIVPLNPLKCRSEGAGGQPCPYECAQIMTVTWALREYAFSRI